MTDDGKLFSRCAVRWHAFQFGWMNAMKNAVPVSSLRLNVPVVLSSNSCPVSRRCGAVIFNVAAPAAAVPNHPATTTGHTARFRRRLPIVAHIELPTHPVSPVASRLGMSALADFYTIPQPDLDLREPR